MSIRLKTSTTRQSISLVLPLIMGVLVLGLMRSVWRKREIRGLRSWKILLEIGCVCKSIRVGNMLETGIGMLRVGVVRVVGLVTCSVLWSSKFVYMVTFEVKVVANYKMIQIYRDG